MRKKAPPTPAQLAAAPGPVTIELFGSYAEAKAASETMHPIAQAILSVPRIDGRDQEGWAVERGREVAGVIKAIKERQAKWLAPVRELEATIKSFDAEALAMLEQCRKHLAELVGSCRERAAAAQAALLPAATTETEREQALAVLAPKAEGWVEVERWSWAVRDGGMPMAERRSDGRLALVFGVHTIPPEYFVLDTARLDREAREHKGAMSVPGIDPVMERKGHFRS